MSYDTVQLSMYSCSRVFIWLIVFFCRGEEVEKINKRRKLHSSALGLTRGRSPLRGPWTSLILIDVHDFLFRKKNNMLWVRYDGERKKTWMEKNVLKVLRGT